MRPTERKIKKWRKKSPNKHRSYCEKRNILYIKLTEDQMIELDKRIEQLKKVELTR